MKDDASFWSCAAASSLRPFTEKNDLSRPRYTTAKARRAECGLPPDPVTGHFKKDVDRTLLCEHLKLTPQQRLEKLVTFMKSSQRLAAQVTL
jgi:hypothetical protein